MQVGPDHFVARERVRRRWIAPGLPMPALLPLVIFGVATGSILGAGVIWPLIVRPLLRLIVPGVW